MTDQQKLRRCPFVPESLSEIKLAISGLPMTIAHFVFSKIAETISYLNLTERDIVDKAKEPELCFSGVYFIVQNEKIIYVGQAKNVYSRLINHHVYKSNEKMKIAFLVVDTSYQDLDLIESYYIHKFTPLKTKGAPLAVSNGKFQRALFKEIQKNTGIAIGNTEKMFNDLGLKIPNKDDIL